MLRIHSLPKMRVSGFKVNGAVSGYWVRDVWAQDFAARATLVESKICMLAVIDEFARERLMIEVEQRQKSDDVLHPSGGAVRRAPAPLNNVCFDDGSGFPAKAGTAWLTRLGLKTLCIESGRI